MLVVILVPRWFVVGGLNAKEAQRLLAVRKNMRKTATIGFLKVHRTNSS